MTKMNNDRPEASAYHTVKEVAARWSSCERSVRREINAGNLVSHRFGRLIRISDEDLTVYERLRRGQ